MYKDSGWKYYTPFYMQDMKQRWTFRCYPTPEGTGKASKGVFPLFPSILMRNMLITWK